MTMLGLCTICGDPVDENKQYCHDCQAELDAAYAIRERELLADSAAIARWVSGGDIEHGARQSSPAIEPIRQPTRKHTRGLRNRNDRDNG